MPTGIDLPVGEQYTDIPIGASRLAISPTMRLLWHWQCPSTSGRPQSPAARWSATTLFPSDIWGAHDLNLVYPWAPTAAMTDNTSVHTTRRTCGV